MKIIKKQALIFFTAFVLAVGLSACDKVVKLESSDTGTSAAEASPRATRASTSAITPPVIGMSLENAIDFLKEFGLTASYKDISAAKRTIEYPEQWLIVGQSPRPGEESNKEGKLKLSVIKHGEDAETIGEVSSSELEQDSNRIMINLVGMNLDEAYKAVEEQDLYILEELDGTGEDRSVWMKSNWTVIAQNTPPGSAERSVKVTVKKNGEVTPKDLQSNWVHENWDVSAFYGKVTGYVSDEYHDDKESNLVVVGQTPVELDLIAPYPAGCLTTVEDTSSQATKQAIIPKKTKVLVVFNEPYSNKGFIHKISELNLEDPYLNSTNEQLVATGDWVPDHWSFNDTSLTQGETTNYEPLADWSGYLTDTEAAYAYLIMKTGSSVRANPVGGVVVCLNQSAAYQEEQVRIRALVEESIRQGEAEYQRRKALGWYSCRDGDGDGVCNER